MSLAINPSFDVDSPIPDHGNETDLVVVGRLSERKGQHLLLEALCHITDLPAAQVHLCGDIYPSPEGDRYLARLHALAERLPGRVNFHGFTDKIEAYGLGGVVVVPSTEPDPCPLVVVEAMAAGKAVVAASTGGIPEQLLGAGVEFVAGSTQSLAESLRRVLFDPEVRESARQRSVRRTKDLVPAVYMEKIERVVTS